MQLSRRSTVILRSEGILRRRKIMKARIAPLKKGSKQKSSVSLYSTSSSDEKEEYRRVKVQEEEEEEECQDDDENESIFPTESGFQGILQISLLRE
jgi:hypothetical protein